MSRVFHDFRHALRACRRSPLVSILAVVAFALGIGVTTTVFSIFYGVLLKPLPYPAPDRLVAVYDTQPACATCPASFPKYTDWKERNQVFAAIGGSAPAGFAMSGQGDPVRVTAMQATASLVDVFAVQPAIGRWFSENEDEPGGRKVVVLTHGFWTNSLSRDPGVLGRTLTFDGEPYDVIGVMPEDFVHRRVEVFVPLARKLDPATRGSHFLPVYARLRPEVSLERATSEMRVLGQSLASEFGNNHGIDVRSYREVIVGNVRPQLRMLRCSAGVLLAGADGGEDGSDDRAAGQLNRLDPGAYRREEVAVRDSDGCVLGFGQSRP